MLHVYRKVRAVHHMELCSPPASIRKVLAVRVVSTRPRPRPTLDGKVLGELASPEKAGASPNCWVWPAPAWNLRVCHCDCPLGRHRGWNFLGELELKLFILFRKVLEKFERNEFPEGWKLGRGNAVRFRNWRLPKKFNSIGIWPCELVELSPQQLIVVLWNKLLLEVHFNFLPVRNSKSRNISQCVSF